MQLTHINRWAGSNGRKTAPPELAVVIGAGLPGLLAAQSLAEQGASVSVFDQGSVPVSGTAETYRALLRCPNVRVVGRVEVVDVVEDLGAVRGVRAWLRGLHAAEFPANVVVDATGTGSVFSNRTALDGFLSVDHALELETVMASAR